MNIFHIFGIFSTFVEFSMVWKASVSFFGASPFGMDYNFYNKTLAKTGRKLMKELNLKLLCRCTRVLRI